MNNASGKLAFDMARLAYHEQVVVDAARELLAAREAWLAAQGELTHATNDRVALAWLGITDAMEALDEAAAVIKP